jgi:histidinol-phosphate aminotransferase
MGILERIRAERDRMLETMAGMENVVAYPSAANFVLFRPDRQAADVWRGLLDRGVLVRDMSAVVPGCLRVSAGTPEETALFLGALEEVT